MFTKKPVYVYTQEDYVNEQNQALFFKFYSLFFVSFIGFVYMISWIFGDNLSKLHKEICLRASNSALCSDFQLLKRVDTIARKKNVPTRLLIGIMNAESSLGTNFNKPICYTYYNWAGLKGRKFDDGRVEMFAVNRKKPDKNGCWLYKFDGFDQGIESLANTIAIGYKGCNMKTRCIAYDFVGDPNVAEESWIANVERFYK